MPYHVGEKGSNGCSGYPVVSADGKVMGCHGTEAEAISQVQALYANEPGLKKEYQGCGCPTCKELNVDCEHCPVCGPQSNQMEDSMDKGMEYMDCNPGSTKCNNPDCLMCAMKDEDMAKSVNCCPDEIQKGAPCWDGYVQRGMKPGRGGKMVPNCVPVQKANDSITEGDFVMAMSPEKEPFVGQVEHIMYEGGTYGQPENPYSIQSNPNDPAMAVRMLEEEDGIYYYTPYSVGVVMSSAKRVETPKISLESYDEIMDEEEKMIKAEGYSPPAGARAAARRAIRFKEQGKANGAGTAVGWTRAGQLARGETLSLSTVKRMYSYFSRHEVDKKGKDWGNQSNPSNGYIMWLAWGGDAGFSWSRKIVARETDKFMFNNFGKDSQGPVSLTEVFKRDYSGKTRERMASEGIAMPDGSFPIANANDLRNAIQSVGRAKNYESAKRHIMSRARALGLTDQLPEDWKNATRKGMTGWTGSIFDLNSL